MILAIVVAVRNLKNAVARLFSRHLNFLEHTMKKTALTITAFTLLLGLSGCDDAENATNTPAVQESAEPKQAVEPKLSARKAEAKPEYSDQNEIDAEDIDPASIDAQPIPDMESEKYDDDVGLPNPEAGDPMPEDGQGQ